MQLLKKSVVLTGAAWFALAVSGAEQEGTRDALSLQQGRNRSVQAFAGKRFYAADAFDLSDLPRYEPQVLVSGPIRLRAADLIGGEVFTRELEQGFRRFHRKVRLEVKLGSPGLAFAGLLTGDSDVVASRRMSWETRLAFQRAFNTDPVEVPGMTGWAGNSPFVIVVHQSNPLTKLTLQQLDGIFGAERNGGWEGTTWHPEFARGAQENIRTWGQLGLQGKWRDEPINVHGYGLRYLFSPRFSDDVLRSSDKWNDRLQQYVNYLGDDGRLRSADQQMADAVASDPFAIAYFAHMRGVNPDVRQLALARSDAGPSVELTLDSVRDESYPLIDRMFLYANRRPGEALHPKARELMRFLLSREGQEIVVRDGKLLPLTAATLLDSRRKLD